ncbi:hypothetical protein BH09VER1_BH09VER1_53710 [soil metagenome]
MKIPAPHLLAALLFCQSGLSQTPVPEQLLQPGESRKTDAPPASAASSFFIYPDSETSVNPRIPCIPPLTPAGGVGKTLQTEADFRYALAPFIRFSKGGTLTARIKDNTRRESKEILSLSSGTSRLVLRVEPASKGGLPTLAYFNAGRQLASVPIKEPLPLKIWTDIKIQWENKEARLTVGNGVVAVLPLSAPLDPQSVALKTAMVDNLRLEGEGTFSLDWENGYAANATPCPDSTDVAARLFGFDAYVVSMDPSKRDFPIVQVLNGSAAEREVNLDFDLVGEVTGLAKRWSQKVRVPPRSGALLPVEFQAPLASDVYHLNARSDTLPSGSVAKHFIFVQNRVEPSGPAKFGLHDSDRRTFGFWPDALGIEISHLYAQWGYIHGPMWTKDPGITENTPPEEWNWNPRLQQAIDQGLTPWVCVVSRPFYPWMREREYEPSKMDMLPFGLLGGFPNLERYRIFIKALVQKYQGKIRYYEVENEPIADHGGLPAQDYVDIAKAVFEEVHAADPQARVYGISGTGDFLPWMKEVLALGGDKFMDGVSIHTYVTPALPEAANLSGKIAEVNKLVANTGRPLSLFNSETGTYVALREEVGRPISRERLAELIKQGVAPFAVPSGWPGQAVDEWAGSISITQNAVLNFLGGAEGFVFFGWNDKWPAADWWGKTSAGLGSCWGLVSASKDGERTPSLQTLAIGVLAAQLRGAKPHEGRAVKENGIRGGIFPKADGGEVACLWSPQGKRSVLIANAGAVEVVSLFGQPQSVATPQADAKNILGLEVTAEPIYIHTRHPGLQVLPSPVITVDQNASGGFQFTLVNIYPQPWSGTIIFSNASGWPTTPAVQTFALEPGKRVKLEGVCTIPKGTKRGVYTVEASVKLPDGVPYSFPLSLAVRPTFVAQTVPLGFAWDQPSAWKSLPHSLSLDQPDQVVIGRPPALASLQEEKYWKGAAELSGIAKIAANDGDLFVYIEVTDANLRDPREWPGVLGSCVELFLDRRSPEGGLGRPAYGADVHQLVLKAPISGAPLLWEPTGKIGKLDGVSCAGAISANGKYWLALRIPRKPGNTGETENFGFDIGIDGPPANTTGRKSQIMLFGTISNNTNASAFGLGTITGTRPTK